MMNAEYLYKRNNMEALDYALERGKTIYRIRAVCELSPAHSREFLLLRIKTVLARLETNAVALSAVIQHTSGAAVLSVLCASGAASKKFSALMQKIAPQAVIEEISAARAARIVLGETSLYAEGSESKPNADFLPFFSHMKIRSELNSSRALLLSLLYEYRGLAAETSVLAPDTNASAAALAPSASAERERLFDAVSESAGDMPFLFYELNGSLYGVPAGMTRQISSSRRDAKGKNGFTITTDSAWGTASLPADYVQFCEETHVPSLALVGRQKRGFYYAKTASGKRQFIAVVPSLIRDLAM